MKKNLLLIAFLAITSNCIMSAEINSNDTVIEINRPHKVVITENASGVSVDVKGKDDNESFSYSYKSKVIPNAVVTTEQKNTEWNIDFPFMKKKKDSGKFKPKCNFFTGGLGIGFVNAVSAPTDMQISMGSSIELMWTHIVGIGYQPWRRGPEFSIGFGIDWRNYNLMNKKRYYKEDENVIISNYPEKAEIDYSSMKMFSLNVPFLIKQKLGKSFSLHAGVVLNFNTYARIKTKYVLDGVKCEEFDKNIHPNPVTCDLMGVITFKQIGAYVKYSPCDQLNSNYSPKFKSLSTGFIFFL